MMAITDWNTLHLIEFNPNFTYRKQLLDTMLDMEVEKLDP
jgi:hypothetical protein